MIDELQMKDRYGLRPALVEGRTRLRRCRKRILSAQANAVSDLQVPKGRPTSEAFYKRSVLQAKRSTSTEGAVYQRSELPAPKVRSTSEAFYKRSDLQAKRTTSTEGAVYQRSDLLFPLNHIPGISVQILKDDYRTVYFLTRLFAEFNTLLFHEIIVSPKIIGVQE